MPDDPAIATLIFLLALLILDRVLARLAKRSLRAAGLALMAEHLAHWRYPPGSWRAYCERERSALWNRYLRPSARYLPAIAVLVGGLAWIAEQRAGLPGGLASFATVLVALLVANTILGPWLRGFLRLSRRRELDYELYLGSSGALEVWRDHDEIRATEDHSFTSAGMRIERVEADGVDPAEIVFSLARPLAMGFEHSEARFLVPQGRLAEARALARKLTPAHRDMAIH